MTGLGKISAICKIWEDINTTLSKHLSGPRRRGKQPTKKISKGRWDSLHKRYYWPHCWLRKYELKGIYIHFLPVEDAVTDFASASEVMRKRTVPLSCLSPGEEWVTTEDTVLDAKSAEPEKENTYIPFGPAMSHPRICPAGILAQMFEDSCTKTSAAVSTHPADTDTPPTSHTLLYAWDASLNKT